MTQPMFAAFAGFFVAIALSGTIAAHLNRSRECCVCVADDRRGGKRRCRSLPPRAGVPHRTYGPVRGIHRRFRAGVAAHAALHRTLGWVAGSVLLVNVPLGFVQSFAHQVAFDALPAVLAILGVRALAYEAPIAGLYLAGVAGSIGSAIVNDASAFLAGIAWEAAFFAYAVSNGSLISIR